MAPWDRGFLNSTTLMFIAQHRACMPRQALLVLHCQAAFVCLYTHPPHTHCFVIVENRLQASSAYTAGPHHAMFSLSLSSIYKQDALSSGTDFLRVDGVPVSVLSVGAADTCQSVVFLMCRRTQRGIAYQHQCYLSCSVQFSLDYEQL